MSSISLDLKSVQNVDVAVIGGGFGGLGSALSLAERGLKVHLFESLKYLGGCAGTFNRKKRNYEAGATLSSGLGHGQLFESWIRKYSLPIQVHLLDPVIHFSTPSFQLDIPTDRDHFIEMICALPNAPKKRIKLFFNHQKQVADCLWDLFDHPELLPPFSLHSLFTHLTRLPSYFPFIRDINCTLLDILKRYQLDQYQPLITYLNALCQITVQCSIDQVEAPFALSTMDYYFRGTAHIEGGLGQLATGLGDALIQEGGSVSLADRVKSLLPHNQGGWIIQSRQKTIHARYVIANLLPSALQNLLGKEHAMPKRIQKIQSDVEQGWGAVMLYGVIPPNTQYSYSHHRQMVADEKCAFQEGNHVFCSIKKHSEEYSTLTLSTHVPMKTLLSLAKEDQGHYIQGIQDQMKTTLNQFYPDLVHSISEWMPGSPRTFERFTGRPKGFVGGAPKTKGYRHYLALKPYEYASNLYLVGDSVFPGQSTLATATGGVRLAEWITRIDQQNRFPLLLGSSPSNGTPSSSISIS